MNGASDALAAPAAVGDTARRPVPGARILIVDDDPLSRSLQSRLVGLLGYRAEVVEQPATAVERALGDDVDAMLLDLGMPAPDGFALLAQLREREAALSRRPLPVIAVTGYAASLDRLRCLMAGFNDHLSKPVDVASLSATLERNLRAARHEPDCDAQRVEATARRLSNLRPGDDRFGPTMLEAFALRSQQLIEELQQACARQDAGGLLHAATALYASAEFMGATGMASMCARLRGTAAAARFDQAAPLIDGLASEHATVLAVLLGGRRHAPGPS
jgi:two-component system, sensor histidine kinase and response regulator